METKSKITAANFIFIAIYITLGNSLLEEFFFRGFIFLNLRQLGKEKFAYLFSALLFAIYHISIFQSWFTLPLMLLSLFGLFTIGIVFNWLNTKTNTIINSWIVHIFADLAIILIGLKLFEII
jgi:membrane protease YdiL (CAAX protease family)